MDKNGRINYSHYRRGGGATNCSQFLPVVDKKTATSKCDRDSYIKDVFVDEEYHKEQGLVKPQRRVKSSQWDDEPLELPSQFHEPAWTSHGEFVSGVQWHTCKFPVNDARDALKSLLAILVASANVDQLLSSE